MRIFLCASALFVSTLGMAPTVGAVTTSPCPNLDIGAQVCFSPAALSLAEGQFPIPPELPSAAVAKLTHLPLTKIVIIHGAGAGASRSAHVDGITFIYGNPPRDGAGDIPDNWPAEPRALLIEELSGRIYTGGVAVNPVGIEPPYPKWGPWEAQANLPKRAASLDIRGNLERTQMRTLAAQIREEDTGGRPHIAAPPCVAIRSARTVPLTLTSVYPGRSFSFTMVPGRLSKSRRHRAATGKRVQHLGVLKSGIYGEIHLKTKPLSARGDLGTWSIQASNSKHKVVAASTLRVQATSCSTHPTLAVTSPKVGLVWHRGTRHTISWRGTGLKGKVTITLHNLKTKKKLALASGSKAVAAKRHAFEWLVARGLAPDRYSISLSTRSGKGTIKKSSGAFRIT